MSLEFRKTTLGELITFSNGRTSPDRVENGQFPVFGSNGLIGKSNESNSDHATFFRTEKLESFLAC